VRLRPILLLPLALAACKVEPTPRTFYNHRNPAGVELEESAGEVRARVTRFAGALVRGDSAQAMEAMNPAELVQVLGPADGDSMSAVGPAGLLRAIGRVRRPAGGVARAPDLHVSTSQTMGWFSTHVEMIPVAAEGRAERLRLSGVFARDRGDWRLVEAHFSQPAPPADSVAADSSAAAASSRDSAAARGEGG
jgi:hypothetical protein